MKTIITISILFFSTILFSQYNYGLDVCNQDAKIEGKLNLDSGNSNVFIGTLTGTSNTTGSHNNFFGQFSGAYNTTGNSNSFFGSSAGLSNTAGSSNSFFGVLLWCRAIKLKF